MTTKEQVLQNCTVEGTVVKLPNVQLDRKLYQEVAKALELIGGKWKGGKVFGFVFATDPTDLLHQIANGEKGNLKKEFQFFATPENEPSASGIQFFKDLGVIFNAKFYILGNTLYFERKDTTQQ